MKKTNKPTVIDLFCGIGGFSKGFEQAGYSVSLGVDNWSVALNTFKENHKDTEIINSNIEDIEDAFFLQFKGTIDVVIGGPPCQGFSMSGRRDINDKRNTLFEEFVRVVKIVEPKVVVLENVVGLLSMKSAEGELIKDVIEEKFKELGYSLKSRVLNASEYGVPQARKRVVFLGSKVGEIMFPESNKTQLTVTDALSNIPDVGAKQYLPYVNKYQKNMASDNNIIFNHEAMKHNSDVQNRIKHVPPGGNWRDIPSEYYNVGGEHSNNYRRLNPTLPSITLKHASKSMIIHPVFNRVITAREVARLQSFPDNFCLLGTKFEQHQQLANAVPPLLGFEIAKEILKVLNI